MNESHIIVMIFADYAIISQTQPKCTNSLLHTWPLDFVGFKCIEFLLLQLNLEMYS